MWPFNFRAPYRRHVTSIVYRLSSFLRSSAGKLTVAPARGSARTILLENEFQESPGHSSSKEEAERKEREGT
ncbi:hypothetical protein chiPu_0007050 [Chiloscyllium punctatum]|uniref:Uncharacterized protein n=1 Tax=Chiloscyllium punctatum TaxID=137246 RepID=A0A401SDZ0_CHIPU|nr:hypothetical protein [Chiloscyllium punctatum]